MHFGYRPPRTTEQKYCLERCVCTCPSRGGRGSLQSAPRRGAGVVSFCEVFSEDRSRAERVAFRRASTAVVARECFFPSNRLPRASKAVFSRSCSRRDGGAATSGKGAGRLEEESAGGGFGAAALSCPFSQLQKRRFLRAPRVTTSFRGRRRWWDPRTLPTKGASSSWTFSFLSIIRSSRHEVRRGSRALVSSFY